MQILKFGGSSLANAERQLRAAEIVQRAAAKEPTWVVVSALAGVTDQLVRAFERSAVGDRAALAVAPQLARQHFACLAQMPPGDARDRARRSLVVQLDRLQSRLASVRGTAGHRRAASRRAGILATGERLAVALMIAHLASLGVDSRSAADGSLMATDSSSDHSSDDARVRRLESRVRARAWLSQQPPQAATVVPGFIGRDRDNRTTNLGRNGSDLTATHLADALDARQVQIWSDVDGVLSGDPRRIDSPQTLEHLSFAEATLLARFGARVLHPRALSPVMPSPARPRGIPVEIRNTLRPQGPYTRIDTAPPTRPGDHPLARAISGHRKVQRLRLERPEAELEAWLKGLDPPPLRCCPGQAPSLELWLTASQARELTSIQPRLAGQLDDDLTAIALAGVEGDQELTERLARQTAEAVGGRPLAIACGPIAGSFLLLVAGVEFAPLLSALHQRLVGSRLATNSVAVAS